MELIDDFVINDNGIAVYCESQDSELVVPDKAEGIAKMLFLTENISVKSPFQTV